MKTGIAAPKTPRDFDIDFNAELPPWEFFPLWQLARSWHCSPEHVANLVESGELPVGLVADQAPDRVLAAGPATAR